MPQLTLFNNREFFPDTGTERLLPYINSYQRTLAANTLIEKLETLPLGWNDQLYEGEAEVLVFSPLSSALQAIIERRNKGVTATEDAFKGETFNNYLFETSMDYFFIDELWGVQYANKTAAQDVTLKSVADQQIFRTLQAINTTVTYTVKDDLKDWNISPEGIKKMNEAFNSLIPDSGLQILNAMAEANLNLSDKLAKDADAYDMTLKNKADVLKKWAKQGKGVSASLHQREKILTARMKVISNLRLMLAPAAGIDIPGNKCSTLDFYDGLAGTLTFLDYLKTVQDYDSFWPLQPYTGNSLAWTATLCAAARKLAGKWLKYYNITAAFDLYHAIKMLDMALEPYFDIIGNYFPTFKGENKVYWETTAEYIKTVPSCVSVFYEESYRRQITFGEDAKLIVDIIGVTTSIKEQITAAVAKTGDIPEMVWDNEDKNWIIDGEPYSFEFDKYPILTPDRIGEEFYVSPAVKLPMGKRTTQAVITKWQTLAEGILSTIQKLRDIQAVAEAGGRKGVAMTEAQLVTADDWKFKPLIGTLKKGETLPFVPFDPLSRVYTPWYIKYAETYIEPKWKLKNFMWRVMANSVVQQALMDVKVPCFVWENTDYPHNDAITHPYINAALPALYTLDRRRMWFIYSFTHWITQISMTPGYHDDRHILKSVAHTLHGLEDEYRYNVVNALAANMLIYVSEETTYNKEINIDDVSFSLISPNMPALWTQPTKQFIEAQTMEIKGTKSRHNVGLVNGVPHAMLKGKEIKTLETLDLARYEHISSPKKGITTYAFILHTRYPVPVPSVQRLWAARIKTYVPIMVDASLPITDEDLILTEEKTQSYKTQVAYVPPMGWSDLVNPWPHLAPKYASLKNGWEEWKTFQLADVYVTWDDLIKSLMYRAKIHNSAYIMDNSDLLAALDTKDPGWEASAREIKPLPEEHVRPAMSAAFVTGPADNPSHIGPRSSNAQIERDVLRSVVTSLITLTDEGYISLTGGQFTDDDFNDSILAGSAYVKDGKIILNSPDHLEDAVHLTPDNAVSELMKLQKEAEAKSKKKKKDKKLDKSQSDSVQSDISNKSSSASEADAHTEHDDDNSDGV